MWPDLASESVQRSVGDRLTLGPLEAAQGIIDIVNAGMADAVRKISIERGHDPRSFTLVAFGGAGPVHAGRLAQELDIGTVIIPPNPGAFSALGLVSTDVQRDYVRTVHQPLTADAVPQAQSMYAQMEEEARDMLARSGVDPSLWQVRHSMDLRYSYQAYELTIPVSSEEVSYDGLPSIAERFHRAHQTVYGHPSLNASTAPTRMSTATTHPTADRPAGESPRRRRGQAAAELCGQRGPRTHRPSLPSRPRHPPSPLPRNWPHRLPRLRAGPPPHKHPHPRPSHPRGDKLHSGGLPRPAGGGDAVGDGYRSLTPPKGHA